MQDQILSPLFMRQRTSVPYSPLTAGGTGQCCEVGGQAWAGMVTLPSGSVRATCACHGLISVKYPRALGRAEVHPENRDLGFGSPPLLFVGPSLPHAGPPACSPQSGFCEHCRQSQLGWLKLFWAGGWSQPNWLFSSFLSPPVSQVV